MLGMASVAEDDTRQHLTRGTGGVLLSYQSTCVEIFQKMSVYCSNQSCDVDKNNKLLEKGQGFYKYHNSGAHLT